MSGERQLRVKNEKLKRTRIELIQRISYKSRRKSRKSRFFWDSVNIENDEKNEKLVQEPKPRKPLPIV